MRIVKFLVPALLLASLFSNLSYAASQDRIAAPLTGSRTVALSNHVHRLAAPQYDLGPVDPAFRMGTIMMLTVPTANQRRALQQLLTQQQDPTSPSYHKWLTPDQAADRFGMSEADAQKITAWLKGQGFSGIQVSHARNWISFSATAAQVQSAFGTEIHRYNVNGELHYANTTTPAIPAALAGVVVGFRGLHDFKPKPMGIRRARPNYNSSTFGDLVAPGDIATMYDIKALYTAGIDGTGQKLAVAGQTDIFISDIANFRAGFGLSAITGCTSNATTGLLTACNTPNFLYKLYGTDPGQAFQGDLGEADLDLEWSGATARNAQIIYVNAQTAGGAFDAYYNAINDNLAPVISLSYGLCESDNQPFVAPDETELMLGNSQGITIVNSSGDSGAAQCDYGNTPAVNGLSVNYPASSPEVTSVGGTAIPLANFTGTYWGTTNAADGGTALSYIPEQGWNDDAEIAQFCIANPTNLFCTQGGNPAQVGWVPITSAATAQADIGISSTGGGPSNCATVNGSGTCIAGFAKPSWQTVTISGQAAARFTPDVSLPASPNFPGYIFCTQLSELGITGSGSSCANGITNSVDNNASLIGGTSASAPVFAGIVTLLNQYLAGPGTPGLGNVNPKLYALAATTSNGAFHPVTTGNNIVSCTPGTPSCPTSGANTGLFGFNASTADATTGFNLVTGLGSVDVNKLAIAWAASRSATSVSISPSLTQINFGQNVTFTATITNATALGDVSFFNNGSTTALGKATLTGTSNGVVTFSTTTLPAGTDNVTATYNGSGFIKPATTATAATVTVTAPDFTILAAPTSTSVIAGHNSANVTVTFTPINGLNQPITPSCTNMPTGATCAFNPTPVTMDGTNPKTTIMTITTAASMAAATTSTTISATGSGQTHTTAFSLTTTATDQSFTLAPQNANYSVTRPQSVNATLTLTPTNGFNTAVTYTCVDSVSETTCTGPSGATTSTSPAFVITTTAPSRAMAVPFGRGKGIFYAALLPGLLGIMLTMGSRKRSLRGMRMLGLIAVLGVSTLGLGSCSGSNSGTHDPGTPTGAQSVTVNATTGGANPVTATTTINFTVN